MARMRILAGLILAALILVVPAVKAADATQAEVDQLKRDVEDLRKRLNTASAAPRTSSVERALDSKYGPNATVTTKNGKLTISGLVQAWYYTIQKDNRGLFDKAGATAGPDTNEGQDNSSFRIRRTELKFTMDIHENVTAVVMIDPAREATSFPNITDNQANQTIFKRANQVAPEFDAANGPGLGSTANIAGVQTGSGAVPRLLQDAYINYHGVLPHHDFQIGQFKPWMGEEGIRSSAQLDFVERSFTGQLYDFRDLGASIHGTWWDDRFQYWVGAFDGAGNFFQSGGQQQNRADDNDQKDLNFRVLVRPLWSSGESDCGCGSNWYGKLELGGSGKMGTKGESGGPDPINSPINGLNRRKAWSSEYDAWLYYAPGGVVRGLWVRAEGAWIKDRNAPGQVADLEGAGGTDFGNLGTGSGVAQSNGHPTTVWGGYGAIGYKISESRFGEDCGGWLKNFEFLARIDTFQNVQVANSVNPAHTDNYRTNVFTGGINYYIKGHDAKIQMNYNSTRDPEGGNHNFHNVRNDSFVVNFQVAF
jgi:hypothetical protein